jgi:hypothetical protein
LESHKTTTFVFIIKPDFVRGINYHYFAGIAPLLRCVT